MTGLLLDDLRRFVRESEEGTLEILGAEPDWQVPLGPAVNDSRDASAGSLFVALSGEHTDGHLFAAAAEARGALVLLVARVPEGVGRKPVVIWQAPDPLAALQHFASWWRCQFPGLSAIGVTGSVGKTTAKDVIAAALGSVMPVLASPRSFNNELGLPLTLLSLTAEHRAVVLEMGMYDVGDIAFLARLARHTVGVVLNVDAVHLERAGTIERIAMAKQEIIDTLPPDGVAVLNGDDSRVLPMRAAAPGRTITFGLHSGADWRAAGVESDADGLTLTLHHLDRTAVLRSPLRGRHHVHALLAAACVLEAMGLPFDPIVAALAAVPAPAARQRYLSGAGRSTIIDDTYNASPLSMVAALDLLAAQGRGRTVAILGDMLELGPISREKHRMVGEHAARTADLVIAVGEEARHIADAAGGGARWYADKAALQAGVESSLRPGDTVLVKGSRGMAMEEVVAWLVATNWFKG
jgi:UDP-N-acetylmuramoyl-tripeptide--D-alanyl-D-alanine ligase